MSFLYTFLQWKIQCYALLSHLSIPPWTSKYLLLIPKCPTTKVKHRYFFEMCKVD